MLKAKIILVFTLSLILFPTFTCHSQDAAELTDPASDGIYKMGPATVKFIPPPGWKRKTNADPAIGIIHRVEFAHPSDELTTIQIEIQSPTPYANFGEEEALNRLMEQSLGMSPQKITFAGQKAISSVSESFGSKIKMIYFVKGNALFYIIITPSKNEEFDKLLAVADECLKSFEIISIETSNNNSL
ncbi:MAG: hypothetical protein WCI77_06185 [Candidatus Omnitrophota bacterium]